MKLFWKIFFTTMLISAVCIVTSGCFIVHTNFRSQLMHEVEVSQEYGDIVYFALATEISTRQPISASRDVQNVIVQNEINIPFAVLDQEGNVIFTSLSVALEKDMVSCLDEKQGGWMIKKMRDSSYIQTIRPALYENQLFYIETVRNVTEIYRNRDAQYDTLIAMMLSMFFAVGMVTFLITRWILRQVGELTKVTKKIANGSFRERALLKGQDEIATLANHFNRMADRLEIKMTELKEEAERKERFVGAFSHELKTPLTSVIGYADLLRDKEMDASQRRICAEYIFTEGKRLEKLSMRMLELIVLQNHTVNKSSVSIQEMMDVVISIMRMPLEAAKISLCCEMEAATVQVEEELMKTVFLNLIDNARKAIGENGMIDICGYKEHQSYMIRIRDTGRGMEEGELSKIKEAFYMVDKSRTRKQGGAGLGLAICDEILKLHGAKFFLESNLGVGTTATVILKEGDDEE